MATEAYLVINVGIGKTTQVGEALAKLEGVKSVHTVTGPYDIIAAVEVTDLSHLGSLMGEIHAISGIERTTTCVAVTLGKKVKSAQPWKTLKVELLKRQVAKEPIRTLVQGAVNWIEEVGEDYVVVRSERTGRRRRITKTMIESPSAPKNRVIAALRKLGDYI